jgi:hypothetical protein
MCVSPAQENGLDCALVPNLNERTTERKGYACPPRVGLPPVCLAGGWAPPPFPSTPPPILLPLPLSSSSSPLLLGLVAVGGAAGVPSPRPAAPPPPPPPAAPIPSSSGKEPYLACVVDTGSPRAARLVKTWFCCSECEETTPPHADVSPSPPTSPPVPLLRGTALD